MRAGKNFMIDNIRKWALLAPAFIPLVYADIFFFPLVAPKAFFFRIAVTVALLAATVIAYKGQKLYTERLKSWWSWIPGILLLVAYATSIVGVDFYHSFWSVFDRSEGLLALTYIVAYTYLLIISANKELFNRYFVFIAWVASIVGVYAIVQWLSVVSGISIPGILDGEGRIGATIGNAAFLAGFLGLTFFITLFVARESARNESWWLSGALIQLVAILLTSTRGTILAMVAAGGITLVYLAVQGKGFNRKVGITGIIALLVTGGLFVGFRESLQSIPFEPVSRIASIGFEDTTTASRLFVWENMIAKGFERPFTGYGAEHIDYVYNQFYNPQDIVEQWFDRSHNQYLDYFIQFGLGGLILFGLIIAGLIRTVLLVRKENVFRGNMFALLVVTYLLQSFFVFDTINTWIIIFPLFALGFMYQGGQQEARKSTKLMAGLAALISIVGLWSAVFIPAYANLKLGEVYYYHIADPMRAARAVEEGLGTKTFADLEYGYQLYAMYTDRQQHQLVGDEKMAVYNAAHQTLRDNAVKYPYDARTLVYLGHVIEARPSSVQYEKEENIEILTRAINLSEGRPQAYYMLANVYISEANKASANEREGLFENALAILEEYKKQAPGIAEPHLVLAELYNALGRTEEGREEFEQGLVLYDGSQGQDARRIAGYLLAQNKVEDALPYLEDANRLREGDYVVMLDLAKARLITGDVIGAAELVEVIQLEAPALLETEFLLLESLRNRL